jgi:hypothetical protein
MTKLTVADFFPEIFQSSGIDSEELERIIRETVEREYPLDSIKDLKYTEDGIEVYLDDGEIIEIEIDWNEIVVS